MKNPIQISYFSDVLCVWAYVSQIRLDELKNNFSDKVEVKHHHVTLFGDTKTRLAEGWKDRGGFAGFNKHVMEVASQFDHLEINPDVWIKCQPRSSGVPHLFLKAVMLLIEENNIDNSCKIALDNKTLFEAVDWRVREAFFRDAIDISQIDNLYKISESFHLSSDAIKLFIDNGTAMASLFFDMQMKESKKLDGSPTYLLNGSRQKLFGNVGYKIIEANVLELLEAGKEGQASWC
jgi:predicted DsbA family dithiol-disulfide isomerase